MPASAAGPASLRSLRKGRPVALTTLSGEIEDAPRIVSGIAELDRVTGGGFVRGSALLVGGDPGIGKSTLLMQAAAALARRAPHRLRLRRRGGGAGALRAQRLGLAMRRCARRRDQCRGHPGDAAPTARAASRGHRFDPDAVDRHCRIRARHGRRRFAPRRRR
jgi:hypothetical protein